MGKESELEWGVNGGGTFINQFVLNIFNILCKFSLAVFITHSCFNKFLFLSSLMTHV